MLKWKQNKIFKVEVICFQEGNMAYYAMESHKFKFRGGFYDTLEPQNHNVHYPSLC
jgi:hypothetical protein